MTVDEAAMQNTVLISQLCLASRESKYMDFFGIPSLSSFHTEARILV